MGSSLTFLLLIDFVDEAAFFQLPHDAVIDHVFDPKLCAGLSARGFFYLRLGAGSCHQRHHVEEFRAGCVCVLKVGFVGYSAVLGNNFFALFLAGLEKMSRLDVRHDYFFHRLPLAGKIALRRGRADIREIKPLLKIGGADENL